MNKHSLYTSRRIPMFLLVFIGLLTGCTAWGDRLSGPSSHRDPAITYPAGLETVQIGVTTKEEIRNLLGDPTDLQVSSDAVSTHESWAYVDTHPKINPLQYIPGVGVWALSNNRPRHSFSISFSSDGIVEGIVLREIQPTEASQASKDLPENQFPLQPYGKNNPLTHNSKQSAFAGSGIVAE